MGLAAAQPFVPDLPGRWRAAGHVAVVVPVDGPSTAVVESDELQTPPVTDRVVVSGDVIAAAANTVANELAPERADRIGVLGADAVPALWWAAFEERVRERCPGAVVEPADEVAWLLRRVKSPDEQQLLRAASRLGVRAMDAALAAAVPGASEAHVAAVLFESVVAAGGAVYDVVISSGEMSGTLGPSGGAAGAAHWTTRTLRAGDLLRIDAYGSLGGYWFDVVRSIVVGGEPSEEQAQLIAGVPAHPMSGFWGHGLGVGWEPPWIGPNSSERVVAGMCLAVERRAAVAGLGGAQHEENVLVGPDGPEVLTTPA